MKAKIWILLFLFSWVSTISQVTIEIPTPKEFFGFQPGSDGNLFKYEKLIKYMEILADMSPKVHMEVIGSSPMGKSIYLVIVSSEGNIQNLDQLKTINRELALHPKISDETLERYKNEGKVFVLATLSMHSTEVGPAQASPLIAYDLATSNEEKINQYLDEVVFMFVPNHNPDGMNMVVDHYYKYKGTKFQGASMPGVYHKYVGHDNNRDFITLSQTDTRAISSITSKTWFPQVMVEKHQMSGSGVRYFVPPNHDPIAENIDARMWNWIGIFGSNMIKDMTHEGQAGIAQHYLFDNYWPGSTETCLWKNTIAFLTEAASADLANPIYVEPSEISVYGKGLSEYKKSANMPLVWEGGWWRLSDIVEYEISSIFSIIKTAFLHKEDILTLRHNMCVSEVRKGLNEAPFYYIFPGIQHDQSELVKLVNLLREHGVDVYEAKEDFWYGKQKILKGDIIVPLAQPFRPFIKEVLEAQEFPERHYTPGGKLIKPYDITSWSLPLHMGVEHIEINSQYLDLTEKIDRITSTYKIAQDIPEDAHSFLLKRSNNESFEAIFALHKTGVELYYAAIDMNWSGIRIKKGDFIVKINSGNSSAKKILENLFVSPIIINEELQKELVELTIPRVALLETHFHDMDAGWTRFVFDSYRIDYDLVNPENFNVLKLSDYGVLVLPNSSKTAILEGKREQRAGRYRPQKYPPEYAKGIGKEGITKMMDFVNEGGIIISWGNSAEIFTETVFETYENEELEVNLPVRNIAPDLEKEGLYCAGSLLYLNLDKDHPLTMGLPDKIGAFHRGNPVFKTFVPFFDMDRDIIATFTEKNVLASGYLAKPELLEGKTAAVHVRKGKGSIILYSFSPQFRASTHGAYKLIFNGILLQ